MPKDLRSWLKDLKTRIPGEPLTVSREVQPSAFEVSAILHKLEERGKLEAVLFEKVTSVKGEAGRTRKTGGRPFRAGHQCQRRADEVSVAEPCLYDP
jgi:hypothetical protein